ncbi:acyltransferase-domain-containing protein [Pluteus cervinus]|uniref:Acyltransferase-domain-containing protein n=1 Tax=Pluteus cervinus TaxID=181527 RepID=A0ACD3B155_9AGAR|nr:acyltransferase-domain-containing protein [Pluteus cervinus]
MGFFSFIVKPIAYISIPVFLIRSLSSSSPTGEYYARVTVYLSAMSLVAACSAMMAIPMAAVGKQYDVQHAVARTFYFVVGQLMDLNVKVEGEENLEKGLPGIIMSNHQSMLDVFVIGRLMPKRATIMAKESLLYTPLGPFMKLSGSIFVNRGNHERALASLAAAARKIKAERVSLWIFPEGTRTLKETPDIMPLKKGGFHLAVQAGIPIIPVVVENYWSLYKPGWFTRGTLRVRVLPAISTAGKTAEDVNDLISVVREQMLTAIRDMTSSNSSSSSPPPPAPAPSTSTLTTPSSSIFKPSSQNESDKGRDLKVEVTPLVPLPPAVLPSVPVAAEYVERGMSSASLSSSSSLNQWKSEVNSENGVETEEDEGMILVGRPT